ncbi:developmentally-regulated gtp-binding protein [Anaeramoeba ignava]|uniref:Developmentally-regulated gtp-binding protein n=1 Tax=Anaeramoeba ignava TaxID=1746090 RepID=A0A9Q0LTM3_ANAIG|nr:developmentally-regulated gtp-binding protein [Anaeramoeba ignava]
MGIADKIKEIEDEIARTQKNKATERHIGLLKARLAKYRMMLLEKTKSSGGKSEGFDVAKYGDARVALVGFPSVGKSSFLSQVTKTQSAIAEYAFTTLTAIPGIIKHEGATIQLLDLPGIIEGAATGKGRGRQVVAAARTADLILMVLDASNAEVERRLLEIELEEIGIRLNQQKPNVTYQQKRTGGIKFTTSCQLTHLDDKMATQILHEYRVHNAEILVREDITVDQFVDVIVGNAKYMKCMYLYNKIDTITMEEIDRLGRSDPNGLVCSCKFQLNLDRAVEKIWRTLDFMRIYTKKKGSPPDFVDPFVLPRGGVVGDFCKAIHKELFNRMRHAVVWGRSVKHSPQKVGKNHPLADEDVVQIVTKNI